MNGAFLPIPLIGLGTYNLVGEKGLHAMKEALKIGYRHLDTAHVYENQKEVGKAIKGYPRNEIFITSKVLIEEMDPVHPESAINKSCQKALNDLDTSYLDLYFVHWPLKGHSMVPYAHAMNKLKELQLIRYFGVSNFSIDEMESILQAGIQIDALQVEFHPYLYQKDLLDYCNQHKIQLIAYRPFGKGALLKEPIFSKIAEQHHKKPEQVILRWLCDKGIASVPKASSKPHLITNFDVFDFSLSIEETRLLDSLNVNRRYCQPERWISS